MHLRMISKLKLKIHKNIATEIIFYLLLITEIVKWFQNVVFPDVGVYDWKRKKFQFNICGSYIPFYKLLNVIHCLDFGDLGGH